MNLPLGNLITHEISDIWNSKNAKLARESILDGSFRYCYKLCCPFCNNETLADLSEDEMKTVAIENIPIDINVAFDLMCNHACPSCREHIYKPDEKYFKELDAMIEKISPYLNKAKVVSMNGNGDVFANPRMMKMLSSIQPEHDDFTLALETNGVLFTPENWAKISHLSNFKINITITPNSFERDTFKYLSGGLDNLDKLIKNLHFVKSLKKVGDINVFDISIVVQDRNFRELPSFTQRSLDEFEADSVTIKPIYQWFGTKDEVYWFKNIRNPLHPYHNEWLEMMKSPILDNPRVFHWGGREPTEPMEHPLSRCRVNQNVLLKLTACDNPGWILKNKLGKANRVALCTIDEKNTEDYVARYIGKLLKEIGAQVCFLRRFTPAEKVIEGIQSCGFPDIDFNSVDMIIVTDSLKFQKLKTDILNHNFTGDILSLEELVKDL
jgi:organic radical activating enzyme